MKKIAVIALLSVCSTVSFAKDGFYRAASIGAGGAWQNKKAPEVIFIDHTVTYRPTTAMQASMDLGYNLHNWRFVAGVQYLADGYDVDNHYGLTGKNYHVTARFQHLNIPVRVGYTINLSKKLAVIPYVGASAGYNFNMRQVDKNSGETKVTRDTDEQFDFFGYNRISISAMGQLDVRYQLCDMMAITAGPRYNTMLGSMQKENPSKYITQPLVLTSATLNIGVELTLPGCGGCCGHSCAKPGGEAGE